jgi:Tfp pilus assembly major pilin PilA
MKQKGFIQLPILIAIITGILVIGGSGYFGVKQYQNYQVKEKEKENVAQEKEKQIQAVTEAQQKALDEAMSEIESLKKQTENQKNKQDSIERRLSQDKSKNITEVTAEELSQYLTGIVRISCGNASGSGTLRKYGSNQYSVVTNSHVVKNLPANDSCLVVAEDLNGKTLGAFSAGPTISNWNNIADEAVLDLRVWDKMPNLGSGYTMLSIRDLNYGISSLPTCPESMPVGSPVAIVGYPAFSEQQLIINGVSQGTELSRIVSDGIISGYDTMVLFQKLPYKNYFISAKIDSGNSGGMAFSKNENGLCDLGIPTWLITGNYETQGLVQNIHNVVYTNK